MQLMSLPRHGILNSFYVKSFVIYYRIKLDDVITPKGLTQCMTPFKLPPTSLAAYIGIKVHIHYTLQYVLGHF